MGFLILLYRFISISLTCTGYDESSIIGFILVILMKSLLKFFMRSSKSVGKNILSGLNSRIFSPNIFNMRLLLF